MEFLNGSKYLKGNRKGKERNLLRILVVSLLVLQSLATFSQGMIPAQKRAEAFRKSYEYESSKDYSHGVDALLALKEDSYAVNLRLGWLYYNMGEYKTSMLRYAKSIQLRPNSIEARFGYVLPAAKLKEWKRVASQYDAILKLDPNNSKANYYRGLMFYNVGEYEKAAPYFDKIEANYPFDYDIVILSAWNNYYLKNIEKARQLFRQALLIQPSSASALQGLKVCK